MKNALYHILTVIFCSVLTQSSAKEKEQDSTSVAIIEHLSFKGIQSGVDENIFPLNNSEAVNEKYNAIQYLKILPVYTKAATDYLKVGENLRAEKMILKGAMPLSFAYGDEKSNYECFMLIGKSYFAQRKFTEAKWFFIQANTSSKKMKNKTAELNSLMELAKVKKTIGDKKLALKDYVEAQKLAVKLKSTFNANLAKANILALN